VAPAAPTPSGTPDAAPGTADRRIVSGSRSRPVGIYKISVVTEGKRESMNDYDFGTVTRYEQMLDDAADVLQDEPAFVVADTPLQSAGNDHPCPDALTDADQFRTMYDTVWKYRYDSPEEALYRFAGSVGDTDTHTVGTIRLADPVPRTRYDRDAPDNRDSTGETLAIDLRITEDLAPYLAIDEGILNPEKSGVKAYIEHITDTLYDAGFAVKDRYTGDIQTYLPATIYDTAAPTDRHIASDDD
jgi:hypothetical protein